MKEKIAISLHNLSNDDVAHLSMRSPQHHGHKGDPRVTPKVCGAIDDRAQVIVMWMKSQGIENTSYPQKLGVMRVRP